MVLMAVSYFKSSKLILWTELPGTFGGFSARPGLSCSLRPGCSCQCTSEETFGSNLTATKEQKMTYSAGWPGTPRGLGVGEIVEALLSM